MRQLEHPRRVPKTLVRTPGRPGRPLTVEKVRVMSVSSVLHKDTFETLRFTFSWDVIERLLKYRDGPQVSLGPHNWSQLRLSFTRFEDRRMPACFVQLAPGLFPPSELPKYPKVTKTSKGHQFTAQIRAIKLGVTSALVTQELETLWLEHPKFPRGLMVIFQDADMLYAGEKANPVAALSQALGSPL